MKSVRGASKLALSIAGLLIFASILGQSQQHATTHAGRSSANRQNAQQIFSTTCAACHGLDGMGSERAPNIITNPQVQKLTATEMFGVISGGVPGTGMPAFQRLGKPAITSLVAYVKSFARQESDGALARGS